MDNVTHSLAGLVLAECAVRIRERLDGAPPSARFRRFAATSSVIAANLLDADLLYTGVGGDRLAYLLHHRGHTHTIVLAVAGALLLSAIVWLLWRRPRGEAQGGDGRWLSGLILVGTLSHLALDWTNSYGIHPFWPFDNRWRYGDAMFIVEPWLWVVPIPMLVAATGSRVGRGVLSLILLVGLGLAWTVDMVSTGAAATVTGGALLSIMLARLLRPGARAAAAAAGWTAVTVIMSIGSTVSRTRVIDAVRESVAGAELLDVVIVPLPANPVCASVIAIEREGETYRLVTGRVSAAASVTAASRCPSRGGGDPFSASARRSSQGVQWDAEWSAPAAALITLARESCHAHAALRFLRAPIWRSIDDSTFVLGDARYGGGSGTSFSDVVVPRRATTCPTPVPPWTPPRSDLLDR